MSTTIERSAQAARDPRKLCSTQAWEEIVSYAMNTKHYTRAYADMLFGQLLVWILAQANDPLNPLAMSEPVDEMWHTAIAHSVPYTQITEAIYGGYLHHIPPPPSRDADADAIRRTLPALKATGYTVVPDAWVSWRSCCPPNPPQPGSSDN